MQQHQTPSSSASPPPLFNPSLHSSSTSSSSAAAATSSTISSCFSRVVQSNSINPSVSLFLYRTVNCGWSVRTAHSISPGVYICEYIGEVIHDRIAEFRGERGDDRYIWTPVMTKLGGNQEGSDSDTLSLDANLVGNIARFVNHSCNPNVVAKQMLIECEDIRIPRIAFFAKREIKVGDELTIDYHYNEKIFECKCSYCSEQAEGREKSKARKVQR